MYNNKTIVNWLVDRKLAYCVYESHINLAFGVAISRVIHWWIKFPNAKQVIHVI